MSDNDLLGMLSIGFGGFAVYCAISGKEKLFVKKEAMKKLWGEVAGTWIHFIAFAVIPIVAGIILILT